MRVRFLSLLLCVTWPVHALGAAACAMAKWQGNTLDYALVTGKGALAEDQTAALALLRDKGYGRYGPGVDITHLQGGTALPHGFAVVIRSDFKTQRNRVRTSYGCGFSAASYDQALWEAIHDLQRYSWGWIPDRDGYQVVEKRRY
jgi:hypothetical protein